MEKIKYSFIIPAYNSEKYILNCINSICGDIEETQIANLCEIVIIENGSTDNTAKIVEDIIKKSNLNIKLFYSEKGVSIARNVGIKESNGELIIFVDADDLWISGSLEKIEQNYKEYNSDLYVYSFVKGTINEKISSCYKNIHQLKSIGFNDIENIKAWMISKPTLRMQAWAKVFRSDIIKNQNIYFIETLRYSEDSEFVIRYLLHCKSIYVSSYVIYKYTISIGSAMRTADDARVNWYIESMMCSNKVINDESEIIKKAFVKYVLAHLNIILVHDVFEIKKKPFKNHTFINDYNKMKEIIKKDIFSESLKNVSIKECFSTMYLPDMFLKLHLGFFTSFLCYLKSYLNSRNEKK